LSFIFFPFHNATCVVPPLGVVTVTVTLSVPSSADVAARAVVIAPVVVLIVNRPFGSVNA
jgi:hypothetical protein